MSTVLLMKGVERYRKGEEASIQKENLSLMKVSPEYSLEGLILKLKLQSFGHLM